MPRVSVIVPAHNAAPTIAQAIDSVLGQAYADYELIVIDDGSTDGTPEAVARYGDRLRYVWQVNQERAEARNHGVRLAQGELIAFLDADDAWLPGYLQQQVAALDEHPHSAMVSCLAVSTDLDGRPIHFWGCPYIGGSPDGSTQVRQHGQELLLGSYLLPSVVVARRSALDQVGLFDPSAVPVEDWDLWLRLASAGSFVYLSLALCRYRTRGGSLQELLRRASDKVMDSTTYVIRKAVESQPQRYPAAFGDHALGMTRASSALASYELGDTPRGRRMMTHAVEADPVLAQREHLTWMLENHARRIVDDTGDETKAIHFLDQVIHNLPPGVDAAELSARRVLSRIYLADVFRAADAQDRTSMRRKLWAGLRLDPTWLMNRGVLSLIARSLFA